MCPQAAGNVQGLADGVGDAASNVFGGVADAASNAVEKIKEGVDKFSEETENAAVFPYTDSDKDKK